MSSGQQDRPAPVRSTARGRPAPTKERPPKPRAARGRGRGAAARTLRGGGGGRRQARRGRVRVRPGWDPAPHAALYWRPQPSGTVRSRAESSEARSELLKAATRTRATQARTLAPITGHRAGTAVRVTVQPRDRAARCRRATGRIRRVWPLRVVRRSPLGAVEGRD